jgi:hypothetical protein
MLSRVFQTTRSAKSIKRDIKRNIFFKIFSDDKIF